MRVSTPQTTSDPARGLVIGTAIGYGFRDVEPFLTSLRRVGFAGAVILTLARGVSAPDLARFDDHGVTTFVVRGSSWIERSPHTSASAARGVLRATIGRTPLAARLALTLQGPISRRWGLYPALAAAFPELFSVTPWIFLSDTRDVCFQSDPSGIFTDLCRREPLHLFLEGNPGADARDVTGLAGALTIGDQPDNANWIEFLGGPAMLQRLKDRQIVCAGTILLTAPALAALSPRIVKQLATPHARSAPGGLDQGALNVLYHTGALSDLEPSAHANADAGVMTMGACSPGTYAFHNGALLVGGTRPPVVHQYDRVPAIRAAWTEPDGQVNAGLPPSDPSTPQVHAPIQIA